MICCLCLFADDQCTGTKSVSGGLKVNKISREGSSRCLVGLEEVSSAFTAVLVEAPPDQCASFAVVWYTIGRGGMHISNHQVKETLVVICDCCFDLAKCCKMQ